MWSVEPNKIMAVSQKSKKLAVIFKNKAHFNQNHMNMTIIYIKACKNYKTKLGLP